MSLVLTLRHILQPDPWSFLLVFPLSTVHLSSFCIFPACYCLLLNVLHFLLLLDASYSNVTRAMYAFIVSAKLLESTTNFAACKLYSILLYQLVSPQAVGNLCDVDVPSLPSMQCGTRRLLYLFSWCTRDTLPIWRSSTWRLAVLSK